MFLGKIPRYLDSLRSQPPGPALRDVSRTKLSRLGGTTAASSDISGSFRSFRSDDQDSGGLCRNFGSDQQNLGSLGRNFGSNQQNFGSGKPKSGRRESESKGAVSASNVQKRSKRFCDMVGRENYRADTIPRSRRLPLPPLIGLFGHAFECFPAFLEHLLLSL